MSMFLFMCAGIKKSKLMHKQLKSFIDNLNVDVVKSKIKLFKRCWKISRKFLEHNELYFSEYVFYVIKKICL